MFIHSFNVSDFESKSIKIGLLQQFPKLLKCKTGCVGGTGHEGIHQLAFMLFQLENFFLDGMPTYIAVDGHVALLSYAMRSVSCLLFRSRIPPRVENDDRISRSQIQAGAPGFQ